MTDKLCCTACEASWLPAEGIDVCWNCGAVGRPLFTMDNRFMLSMSAAGGFSWSSDTNDLPGPADPVLLEPATEMASKQRGGDGE